MKTNAHHLVRLAGTQGADLMLRLTSRRGPNLARELDFTDPCITLCTAAQKH